MGLWHVIEDDKPEDQTKAKTKMEKWYDDESKARGIIFLMVDAQFRKIIKNKTAREAWDTLKQQYGKSVRTAFNEMQLMELFFTLNLNEGDDINVFIGKLEDLKFKLEAMSDEPPINNKMMAYKLIQALPDSWKEWVSGLRGNMDMSQKIDYEQIKVRIIQENQIRSNSKQKKDRTPPNEAFSCKICKKTNHKTENCFRNKSKQREPQNTSTGN
jgi:hypothetical protein